MGFAQPSNQKTVNLIVDQMHVQHQLDERIASLDAQLSSNIFGLPDAKNEQMVAAFRESFNSGSIITKIKDEFRKEIQKEHANATQEWISGKVGQMITNAQSNFYSLQGKRKQIIARYELEQNPPSEKYLATVDSLVSATSAVESTLDTYTVVFRSAIGAFVTLSNQQSLPSQQIEAIVNNYRTQTRPQIANEVSQKFKVIFYETDQKILEEYLTFSNTEAGQWLHKTITKSIQTALDDAAERFEQAVQAQH